MKKSRKLIIIGSIVIVVVLAILFYPVDDSSTPNANKLTQVVEIAGTDQMIGHMGYDINSRVINDTSICYVKPYYNGSKDQFCLVVNNSTDINYGVHYVITRMKN